MIKRIIIGGFCALFLSLPLSASDALVIEGSNLSTKPLFVDYNSNGIKMQLIAVKNPDGSLKVSLNTCQACNPSPRAYFEEFNGRLVCQNCGNIFAINSIGRQRGGCNPMYIPFEADSEQISVKYSDLDRYSVKFTNWKKR